MQEINWGDREIYAMRARGREGKTGHYILNKNILLNELQSHPHPPSPNEQQFVLVHACTINAWVGVEQYNGVCRVASLLNLLNGLQSAEQILLLCRFW